MILSGLNKLCEIRDFSDELRRSAIRTLEPEYVQRWPSYPSGMEHRKSWEHSQLVTGLDALNAVDRDSLVLAVAPGTDRAQFALTRRARLVFAAGLFAGTPTAQMLTEPEKVATFPFERNRLIVQHMTPTDLRHEGDTFDFVYALGLSGGVKGVLPYLTEMVRVCRPGGVVMLTMDCAVRGSLPSGGPLTSEDIRTLVGQTPGVELVHPVDWSASDETWRNVRSLDRVVADLKRGHTEYPHVALEHHGCRFTSLSLFLRKGRIDG